MPTPNNWPEDFPVKKHNIPVFQISFPRNRDLENTLQLISA